MHRGESFLGSGEGVALRAASRVPELHAEGIWDHVSAQAGHMISMAVGNCWIPLDGHLEVEHPIE